MKRTDYILIQAPMVTDLKLSGNNLIIFALIHGFTKDGNHLFSGSIDYIAKWANISKRAVIKNLKQLTDEGFISKFEEVKNGVRFCSYCTNYDKFTSSEQSSPVVNNVHGGGEQSSPNNIIDNNSLLKESKKKDSSLSFVSPEYQEVFSEWLEYKNDIKDSYKSPKSLKACYNKLLKLSDNNPETARQIVEQSMANNWKGLFALKDETTRRTYRDAKQEANDYAMQQFLNRCKAAEEGLLDETDPPF